MELIDIGINLMHRSYQQDRQAVIENAAAVGVSTLMITGTDVRSSQNAARLAAQYPGKIYSTAGVHPHDAKNCNESTLGQLKQLAAQPQVVAIGECGLDYDRNFSPPETQRLWFEKQLQLAQDLAMPLFLHERRAHEDFIKILAAYPQCAQRSVVHCFTGTAMEALAYLQLGCFIGVTGWVCDDRRNHDLRDALAVIPPERLLIETDGPFLTPRDLPNPPADRRNEPKYLPHILASLAHWMEVEEQALAAQTTANAKALFGLQ